MMHISLVCLTLVYIFNCFNHSQETCRAFGTMQLFFEAVSYLNIVAYLKVLRKHATNPTGNVKMLIMQSLGVVGLLAGIIVVILVCAISDGMRDNIKSNVCGLYKKHQSDDQKSYLELLASWPLLLVPYMIYRCNRTTETVPDFVLNSLRYYVQQVQLYIYVFTVRMCLTLVLSFAMIASQNDTVSEYITLMYNMELIFLASILSISKESCFNKFASCSNTLDKLRGT
jgi:hypothetical protein